MEFTKYETDFGPLYKIKEGSKELDIYLASNFDLCWQLYSNSNDNSITITKDNKILYDLFEQLFIDIENINIFKDENSNIPFCFNDKYIQDKYIKQKAIDPKLKIARYRRHNISCYNDLFDEDNKIITWCFDDLMNNKLLIKKIEDNFIINFLSNTKDESTLIRFNNKSNRYGDFYLLFMKFYYNLNNIEPVKVKKLNN